MIDFLALVLADVFSFIEITLEFILDLFDASIVFVLSITVLDVADTLHFELLSILFVFSVAEDTFDDFFRLLFVRLLVSILTESLSALLEFIDNSTGNEFSSLNVLIFGIDCTLLISVLITLLVDFVSTSELIVSLGVAVVDPLILTSSVELIPFAVNINSVLDIDINDESFDIDISFVVSTFLFTGITSELSCERLASFALLIFSSDITNSAFVVLFD
jgi:hypothetical protein